MAQCHISREASSAPCYRSTGGSAPTWSWTTQVAAALLRASLSHILVFNVLVTYSWQKRRFGRRRPTKYFLRRNYELLGIEHGISGLKPYISYQQRDWYYWGMREYDCVNASKFLLLDTCDYFKLEICSGLEKVPQSTGTLRYQIVFIVGSS